MTIDQVRHIYRKSPFQPFVIHIADGRDIRVNHQEFLSMSPSGRTIIIHQPDDSFEIIDLLLVTSLEVTPHPPSSTPGNGKT
jgi:hypothetical protein